MWEPQWGVCDESAGEEVEGFDDGGVTDDDDDGILDFVVWIWVLVERLYDQVFGFLSICFCVFHGLVWSVEEGGKIELA